MSETSKSIFNGRDRSELPEEIIKVLEHLEQKNKNKNDDSIVFDEGPHIYYIDGIKSKISCTGLCKSYFHPFEKEKVARLSFEAALNNPKSKYVGMSIKNILDSWNENGQISRDLGTLMHSHIEYDMNRFQTEGPEVEWDSSIAEEFNMFKAFWDVYKDHITPFRTEWCVFDKELSISGSVDMVFESTKSLPKDKNMSMPPWAEGLPKPVFKENEKRYYIFDWKRSKDISFKGAGSKFRLPLPGCNYSEYSIQLNVYRTLLERNYKLKIAGMVLVVLHPNNKTYKTYSVPFLDGHIDEIITTRINNLKILSELDSKTKE